MTFDKDERTPGIINYESDNNPLFKTHNPAPAPADNETFTIHIPANTPAGDYKVGIITAKPGSDKTVYTIIRGSHETHNHAPELMPGTFTAAKARELSEAQFKRHLRAVFEAIEEAIEDGYTIVYHELPKALILRERIINTLRAEPYSFIVTKYKRRGCFIDWYVCKKK